MNPATLVVGLGGSLAGDDAIGLILARHLAGDPRLPPGVEVIEGGADLLRLEPRLVGRRRVVLVDAVLARPGETEPLVGDHPFPGLDAHQTHAHHLSAVQALELLRLTVPQLSATRCTWFLVPVSESSPGAEISRTLALRVPALLRALLAILP